MHFYPTEEIFRQVLDASAHVAYIRKDGDLIAYGRMLADGMHCIFVDVCIRPDYQGHKLGTLIMEHLIDKVKDKNYVCIGLFCEEDNKTVVEFYCKLGFEKSNGMELLRYEREDWE